ncbi:glutathione S-transferase family protein [Chitinimonas lacunae]|uniref:Glutathione S-transferase family protein n=1 Tax=Chitinimonas lacunae TaxID=1963018 RepID=A0ABV8MTT9_9NEIS
MALTLYAGSGSPFVWRVWLALEHKQLNYRLQMLSFAAGDLKKPEFLALNPRGKVPVLVDDDFVLYESAAIVEYLDDAYREHTVLGQDPRSRARTRRLIAEIDHYFDSALEAVGDQIAWNEDPTDEGRLDAAMTQIGAELRRFEAEIGEQPWFGGETPSAADYALYSALAYLLRICTKKRPDLGLERRIGPRLSAWLTRLESLAYFDRTYPPHWREG